MPHGSCVDTGARALNTRDVLKWKPRPGVDKHLPTPGGNLNPIEPDTRIMTYVSELACKPWFLVLTNVSRHQNGGSGKVILVLRHMSLLLTNICQQSQHQDHFFADPPILVLTNVCQHQDGPFILACLQHLTNTSSAPPQHLSSTFPAPPQYLPPTQHLGMPRAVKSTCMLGAQRQAANLPDLPRVDKPV